MGSFFQLFFPVAGTAKQDIESHAEVNGPGIKGLEETQQIIAGQVKLEALSLQCQDCPQVFDAPVKIGPAERAQDPTCQNRGDRKA